MVLRQQPIAADGASGLDQHPLRFRQGTVLPQRRAQQQQHLEAVRVEFRRPAQRRLGEAVPAIEGSRASQQNPGPRRLAVSLDRGLEQHFCPPVETGLQPPLGNRQQHRERGLGIAACHHDAGEPEVVRRHLGILRQQRAVLLLSVFEPPLGERYPR